MIYFSKILKVSISFLISFIRYTSVSIRNKIKIHPLHPRLRGIITFTKLLLFLQFIFSRFSSLQKGRVRDRLTEKRKDSLYRISSPASGDRGWILISLLVTFYILSPKTTMCQMAIGTDTLYGNEWINYQQSYYKMTLIEEGIYRVSFETLQAAGVFNGTNVPKGKNFQIFYQGQEVPIYISQTETWSSGDYLEFYGQLNKGEVDQHLYEEKGDHLNPGYSLFTDTASYFLTWNTASNNNRFTTITNDLNNTNNTSNYCWTSTGINYHNAYHRGRSYNSSDGWKSKFDLTEGFANSILSNNQSINFNLSNLISADATLSLRLATTNGDHQLSLSLNGNALLNESVNDWAVKAYQFDIPANQLQNGNNTIQIQGLASENDKFKLVEYELNYPHSYNFEGKDYYQFSLTPSNNSQLLNITNFDHGGVAPVLYDLNNKIRIVTQLENGIVKIALPVLPTAGDFILISQSNKKSIASLSKSNFTNYDFLNSRYDYLILSHHKLFKNTDGSNPVQAYADYRASEIGADIIH